ncbi:hypothetical protein O3M35_005453 [Rhynocoris fuscipes]|uniref:Uncharacterized protein n=1 Tax=Rhynocoris fuscipes TaxID=488301 RepID=A0AAW1DQT1_9HEMI
MAEDEKGKVEVVEEQEEENGSQLERMRRGSREASIWMRRNITTARSNVARHSGIIEAPFIFWRFLRLIWYREAGNYRDAPYDFILEMSNLKAPADRRFNNDDLINQTLLIQLEGISEAAYIIKSTFIEALIYVSL